MGKRRRKEICQKERRDGIYDESLHFSGLARKLYVSSDCW